MYQILTMKKFIMTEKEIKLILANTKKQNITKNILINMKLNYRILDNIK